MPWRHGLVNFTAFLIFGLVPCLPYIGFVAAGSGSSGTALGISAGLTAAALLLMGLLKSLSTGAPMLKSVVYTLIAGAVSAAVGYGVAQISGGYTA